jgi:MFS family permease
MDFRTHKWPLLYCGVALIGSLCVGYGQTYYTGILDMQPFIDDYGTTDASGSVSLSTSFMSMTASIIYIGEIIGALIAGPINQLCGRKMVFYTACTITIAGGVTHLFARGSEGILVLGRLLVGLAVGEFAVTNLLYIGEVAPHEVRGPALMMYQVMQSLAQLICAGITQATSSLSGIQSYQIPFGLLMVLPGLMIICLPFIPETPTWYISRGKVKQAEAALMRINRDLPSYNAAEEVAELQDVQESEHADSEKSSRLALLTDPVERRKLIFAIGAMIALQINGAQFFYSYGVIFAQAIGISQPFTIFLGICIIQLFVVGVSTLLGNKVPRRDNMWWCSWVTWVSMLVIGGLGTKGSFGDGVGWTMIVFTYIIILFLNFSLSPSCYAISAEVAVGRNRNTIVSCSIVINFLVVWLIAFICPYLYYSANLGPMICFVFAGTTLITLAYVWFCVGETTGRSNMDIERFFTEKIPARRWKSHRFVPYHKSTDNLSSGVVSRAVSRDRTKKETQPNVQVTEV